MRLSHPHTHTHLVALAVSCSKEVVLFLSIRCGVLLPLWESLIMFCCALLCVHSSFAITLMERRELVVLLCFLPSVS